jgi:hypothetical protein
MKQEEKILKPLPQTKFNSLNLSIPLTPLEKQELKRSRLEAQRILEKAFNS